MTRAWSTGARPNSVAALPSGLLGRLGGWLMARTNRVQQEEVLALAELAAGEAVLEVGHGPGVLLEMLVASPAGRVVAIDPSPRMRAAAARRCASALAGGRVRLAEGWADATGQPDREFDLVVSVNTLAIWLDLDAGTAELARVVRPGGRVLLSWHGGTDPSRAAREMALSEELLTRVADALARHFAPVERLRTPHCEVFRARRPTHG